MKRSTILILVLFLTACSGGRQSPPSNIDNACAMKSARSSWFKDLRKVERKWGVPDYVILATIHQESKFVSKARTPLKYMLGVIPMGRHSSAYGYAQAIDGTWDWYRNATGNRSAKRHKFRDAVNFMGWYMNESNKRLGISKNDAYKQYLAYHQGHTGFKRGSYRSKTWLTNIASKVQTRANMYKEQLASCSRW
ncbi:MAG: transglycosylase SLT domain-containing protein [Rhodobacteraceae bacterium]|nr:transglycosylase SLT domain-containing protein [Paracoccaceae bacterium]